MSLGSTIRSLSQRRLPSIAQAQQVHTYYRARGIIFYGTLGKSALYSVGSTRLRSMATAAAGKKMEWLIILPDKEGVIEKRLEVRAKHLEGVKPLHSENKIIFGGAMFSHPPKEGEEPLPMVGSALLAYAESKEEVMEMIKNDIYTKSGVWDLDKVQIWPFKSAVRSDITTTSDLHPAQVQHQSG